MIDTSFIGHVTTPFEVTVEQGRLRDFARATGQSDRVYFDRDVAQAAGYRGVLAPPTYLFSLDLDREDPFYFITLLKIDIARVLHGEQAFTYGAPICAGDTITLVSEVTDIYAKKGGAMEFVHLKTSATNQLGEDAGSMTRTVIVRHPQ
ncbi:MaoC family dehydratase N-terminal domain-containing protein [Phycobacter sp. K97]|uniref:MaoC family dehydratase N-terminal domain-containing protein n=1 Tax=Phycobacter sedimenti TaxID=3133977 RepID=UPI00311EEAAB